MRLFATRREVLRLHGVVEYGGTFDYTAWRDHVRRSRAVRDPNPWSRDAAGALETEGLGIMAADMGYRCGGLRHLEIKHRIE